MHIISARTGLATFILAVLGLVGCAQTQDPWTSGVDAEVRYNSKTTATTVATVERAEGLAPGDRILAVDGQDISNAPLAVVQAALRGPIGSIALLSVERQGQVIELKIERRRRSAVTESAP